MKRILALMLVLAMTLVLFAGCGEASTKEETGEAKTAEETPAEPKEEPEEETPIATATVGDKLILEKIGTLAIDDYISVYPGGLTYKSDTGKYGVKSSDGMFDTGAIYNACNAVGRCFEVTQKDIVNYSDMAQVNRFALIDGEGKLIAPASYASFRAVHGSDRYVIAYTATAIATGDDYIVSLDSNKYVGTWCVYDVVTGKTVPNVTGNTSSTPSMYGDLLQASVNGQYAYFTSAGVQVTGFTRMFDNGTYAVEGKIGEVFASDGTKLFGYDLAGYVPSEAYGDYYIAKKYEDGKTTNAVMDKTGTIVSTEFNNYISKIEGETFICNGKVYSIEGKEIAESEYSLTADSMFGKYYRIKDDDDNFSIIDKEGNVYVTGKEGTSEGLAYDSFVAYTKKNGKTYVYSYKDKDYTIKGSYMTDAPWLAKAEVANYRYDLVNTITGEVLLAGYEDYRAVKINDFASYIYATYTGGTELYLFVAESKISEIKQKKVDLLAELTDAFAKEGITVNINKETGEMALDSTVLFGGDSAELTDQGKDFLKKFMKVYTQIAFSPKYNGFITKTLIEGHAAPVQGSSYAQSLPLSEQRAQNVMQYCLSAESGVDTTNIKNTFEAIGHGNSRPILKENGEVNMEASRRVAFTFLIAVDFLK